MATHLLHEEHHEHPVLRFFIAFLIGLFLFLLLSGHAAA
jgi:hypothetical protein